jgi:hypothetical protein
VSYEPQPVAVVVALVGVTILIVRGGIFARVRALWPGLLGCAMCVGFWVGAIFELATASAWTARLGVRAGLGGSIVSVCALLTDALLCRWLGDPSK